MASTGGYDATEIQNELKQAYPTGKFYDPVNKIAKLRASFNRVERKIKKGVATFPLRLAAAWNVGAIEDFDQFPAPGDPSRIKGYCPPQFFVGDFQIGLKTEILADDSETTFDEGGIKADRVEGTVADLATVIDLTYAGTRRGRVGIVEADGGANEFLCANPLGVKLIKGVNFPFDVYDALSGGSVRDSLSSRRIATRNASTRYVTYTGADQTPVAGDHIFVAGTYARTPYTIPDIVNDDDLQGSLFQVANLRSTYPDSKASVYSNGGTLRDPSEDIILDAIDNTAAESGQRVTRLLSNRGVARKLLSQLVADRRYPGMTTEGTPSYTIGYGKGSFNVATNEGNLVLETHDHIPQRTIFGLAMQTFGLYVAKDMDWISPNGMMNLVPATDRHKAGLIAYVGSIENLFCVMPKANFRIDDLVDPGCGDSSPA